MLSFSSADSAFCHSLCTACVDTSPAVLGFAAGNDKLSKYIHKFGSVVFFFVLHKTKSGYIEGWSLLLLWKCICDVVTQVSAVSA